MTMAENAPTPARRDDLAGLTGAIERLDAVFESWDDAPRSAVAAYRRAIEALHGEALRRLIAALKSDAVALAALKGAAADEVVYAVLRRHNILKPSLNERVEAALEGVRPLLASHGGDVELVRVAPPAVEVRFMGACDGCAASALTFHAGVRKAVQDACPEITEIHQVKGRPGGAGAESLRYVSPFALHADGEWLDAGALAEIPDGGVRVLELGGQSLLLSRRGTMASCFQNACAHLGFALDGGEIENGILVCPYHGFRYDLATGECLTAPEVQLQSHAVRVIGRRVEVRLAGTSRHGPADSPNVRKARNTMKVSLAPVRRSEAKGAAPARTARRLLAPQGPLAILGGGLGPDGLAQPIAPDAATLFGPRGACLASARGPLFVCDTGHHRLLIWKRAPAADGAPADFVIGQPGFTREGRNAKGETGADSLNVPTGVAAADGVLAVADAWNHRVLIWLGYPEASNQPADVVLGQRDFAGCLANRGEDAPTARTLNWCYGVTIANGRLFVADTGNRRVLVWNSIPTTSGAPADLVLGQRDFVHRDENAGQDAGPLGMRWPHAVAMAGGALLVSDAGSNRVMVWRRGPEINGEPCDFVIGQADSASLDHNRGAYYPDGASLNMPYGIAVAGSRLIVADTANSRLLGFRLGELAVGASAACLAGQPDFTSKGDNRWGPPARDSLCWPYGVSSCDGVVVIANSGNNRVLLWEAAP